MRDPCLAQRPLAGRLGRVASHRQAHVQTTPPDDRQSSQCPLWGAALMHPAVKGHPKATGTVRWFNEQKGYGFIQPDQGGKDVFVHISAVERSGMRGLAEGHASPLSKQIRSSVERALA